MAEPADDNPTKCVKTVSKGSDGSTVTDWSSGCSKVVKDPLAKQILADGKVTQEEWQASRADMISCLTKKGLTHVGIGDDGSVSFSHLGDSDDLEFECGAAVGTDFDDIDFLYQQAKLNPHNYTPMQINQLKLSCLIKAKLLPDSTSVDECMQLAQDNSWPFDANSKQAIKCFVISG